MTALSSVQRCFIPFKGTSLVGFFGGLKSPMPLLKIQMPAKCFKTLSQNAVKVHNNKYKSKILSTLRSATIRQTTTQVTNTGTTEISAKAEKIVGLWLITCAGTCFGAVVLGGVTRLTESGLSMVDWNLFKDMKPPRSEQEWIDEFERYKKFPEYSYVSSQREMTLSDFKFIYYMEYAHRMWGRVVGLTFLIPAAVFLGKGWITKAMKPRLAAYAALIGFQGFLGWYMVKSGLEEKKTQSDIPRVSQYRLAAHLGSAFILYSLFIWQGLTHLLPPQHWKITKEFTRLRRLAHVTKGTIFLTAISGAFVAGLDAGLVYNSWPKMADRWIPTDLISEHISPKWKNIFENPTTVQFNHRHLAEFTFGLITTLYAYSRTMKLPHRTNLALNALMAMGIVQVALGITTLLWYVPTHLAATHQSGSLTLLTIALWVTHELRRLPK